MKEKLFIYSRVSSSVQEEGTSIHTQQDIGIELAKKLDMDYEIHNEGGISSNKDTLDNRPVILNLLRLMDENVVKNIYVWNTDRLSRNQITWYTIRQKMVKNNVVLYTSNGKHTTTDFMENMILGILSEVSQYDNKVRTERSRLGKIEVVKKNYWRGGDTPFGYKLESDGKGNKLVENKTESKWVQFIHTEYSKGTPLKEIKALLEKNQIKTRRENEKWSMGSLQVILKNQTYLGFDHFTDKKTNLTIKNNIPQLISNKLWSEVQERRKLMLLRKGQLNKTKKFYLFRDFLFCSCGTPMGGRIKEDKNVRHYYCPLSERRFNNSYKKDETCEMKRCLNIPTTDKIVWNKIVDILGDTMKMKDTLKEKTIIGKSITSKEVKKIIKEKDEKITELTKTKNKLEKGLVTIETENILNKYPSIEVYKTLKRDVTKKYNQILSEIEDVKNSLKQLGNDELWLDWIDRFSTEMNDNRELSEPSKKELLKLIIEKISVEYDTNQMIHILTIFFKIPVFIQEGNDVNMKTSRVSVTPPKAGRKAKNQIESVETYSTVTDLAKFLG